MLGDETCYGVDVHESGVVGVTRSFTRMCVVGDSSTASITASLAGNTLRGTVRSESGSWINQRRRGSLAQTRHPFTTAYREAGAAIVGSVTEVSSIAACDTPLPVLGKPAWLR